MTDKTAFILSSFKNHRLIKEKKNNTHLLCLSTSLWVLRVPESWSKYFFQPFSAFFLILNLFQWFHSWNQQKPSQNEQNKKYFCLLLKAGPHVKAGRLPKGVPRNSLIITQSYQQKFLRILTKLLNIWNQIFKLSNRLHSINGLIPFTWLNQPICTFKINCKKLLLGT